MTETLTIPLTEYAAQINAAHHAGETVVRQALDYFHQAGVLLLEAKAQTIHGQWLPWLAENFDGTARTAQGYMQLAEGWDELQANTQHVAHLTLRDALKALAAPRPELDPITAAQPIPDQALIEAKRIVREAERQADEDGQERLLQLGDGQMLFHEKWAYRLLEKAFIHLLPDDDLNEGRRYYVLSKVTLDLRDETGWIEGTRRGCDSSLLGRSLRGLNLPPLSDPRWSVEEGNEESRDAHAWLKGPEPWWMRPG